MIALQAPIRVYPVLGTATAVYLARLLRALATQSALSVRLALQPPTLQAQCASSVTPEVMLLASATTPASTVVLVAIPVYQEVLLVRRASLESTHRKVHKVHARTATSASTVLGEPFHAVAALEASTRTLRALLDAQFVLQGAIRKMLHILAPIVMKASTRRELASPRAT